MQSAAAVLKFLGTHLLPDLAHAVLTYGNWDWCWDSTVLAELKDDQIYESRVDALRGWLSDECKGQFVQRRLPILLWRGSRDGFTAATFHRQCDGHAHTLVLIFNDQGHVFGAHSGSAHWQSTSGTDHAALGAFLFLLAGKDPRAPLLLPLRDPGNPHALYNYSAFGPYFRAGWDLCVRLPADAMQDCICTSVPCAYGPRDGACDSTTLAGAYRWVAKEIEVWKL